eukprot:5139106-Prymnesium_polylepis.1
MADFALKSKKFRAHCRCVPRPHLVGQPALLRPFFVQSTAGPTAGPRATRAGGSALTQAVDSVLDNAPRPALALLGARRQGCPRLRRPGHHSGRQGATGHADL